MSKQDSSDVLLGEEDGPVELTSVRKLTTRDTVEVTSDPRASVTTPSEEDSAAKPDTAEGSTSHEEHNGRGGAEGGAGGVALEEGEESKTTRSKRGSELAAVKKIQRPESLEIDDQLSPNAERNPRKSVLRKRDPTPVHAGPTYTSTSPVGEPYDSSGHKRSASRVGRECCSVM